MKRIFKYPLSVGACAIQTHAGATLLTVAAQGEIPHVWAIVDDSAPAAVRMIAVYGTGWELPDSLGVYVGTAVTRQGFVWHVFDMGETQ